jgi:hypothetical protein
MGKWTAMTIVVTAAGTTGAFFNRWPLWIDTAGKAYGRLPLFQPPQIIERVPPKKNVVEKKRALNKKKILPRHAAPAAVEKPQPSNIEMTPENDAIPATE